VPARPGECAGFRLPRPAADPQRSWLLHRPACFIPASEGFLKGTEHPPERSLTPDLLFWLWRRLHFFLAWRGFLGRPSSAGPVSCGTCREGSKAGSLSPSSLICWGRVPLPGTPPPSLGPPGSWGTCCRLALGCPASPFPPSFCAHPRAEPAGRGGWGTAPSQPRASSPGADVLKQRGYFGGG